MADRLMLQTLSPLGKVFLDEIVGEPFSGGSLLRNETYGYQIAYRLAHAGDLPAKVRLDILIDSPLAHCISVRSVGYVPSTLAAFARDADDPNYLRRGPGLYPDPLYPLETLQADGFAESYRSLWITVRPQEATAPGQYPVRITLKNEAAGLCATSEVLLEVIDARLPPQTLLYTQWLHADCIAAYYGLEVFSEAHWVWLERFMRTAVSHGINMLLTPVFTPPLDTKVGGERPTTQLVEVKKTPDGWTFRFDRLARWCDLALSVGYGYIEVSHLFTQWGAKHAPKVIADVGGVPTRVFGWETDAHGPEYTAFLRAFLPALAAFFTARGLKNRVYFHVSDEPSVEDMDRYAQAAALLRECLPGFHIMDALSDYAFYERGLVALPVCATNHIEPFLAHDVRPLWGYYCVGQSKTVSNHFLSMPPARNRAIALQLYKYRLEGFLHWGYNFYYAQYATRLVNPFCETDAGGAFPSGDSFVVYPGEHAVIESINLEVFAAALQDLRALNLLETRIGRDAVLSLMEEGIPPITFTEYPVQEAYFLRLRKRVNALLAQPV